MQRGEQQQHLNRRSSSNGCSGDDDDDNRKNNKLERESSVPKLYVADIHWDLSNLCLKGRESYTHSSWGRMQRAQTSSNSLKKKNSSARVITMAAVYPREEVLRESVALPSTEDVFRQTRLTKGPRQQRATLPQQPPPPATIDVHVQHSRNPQLQPQPQPQPQARRTDSMPSPPASSPYNVVAGAHPERDFRFQQSRQNANTPAPPPQSQSRSMPSTPTTSRPRYEAPAPPSSASSPRRGVKPGSFDAFVAALRRSRGEEHSVVQPPPVAAAATATRRNSASILSPSSSSNNRSPTAATTSPTASRQQQPMSPTTPPTRRRSTETTTRSPSSWSYPKPIPPPPPPPPPASSSSSWYDLQAYQSETRRFSASTRSAYQQQQQLPQPPFSFDAEPPTSSHHQSTNPLAPPPPPPLDRSRNFMPTSTATPTSSSSRRSAPVYSDEPNLATPVMPTSTTGAAWQQQQQQQQPTPKPFIEIEVSPNVFMPLRGAEETMRAIESGRASTVFCFACNATLSCVPDCEMVICPDCRILSPVPSQASLSKKAGTADMNTITTASTTDVSSFSSSSSSSLLSSSSKNYCKKMSPLKKINAKSFVPVPPFFNDEPDENPSSLSSSPPMVAEERDRSFDSEDNRQMKMTTSNSDYHNHLHYDGHLEVTTQSGTIPQAQFSTPRKIAMKDQYHHGHRNSHTNMSSSMAGRCGGGIEKQLSRRGVGLGFKISGAF